MAQPATPHIGRRHLFELMRQDCKAGAVKAQARRGSQQPLALSELEAFRARAERSFKARPESRA
ncbi:MAG: hypothetical protein AAF636_04390 [Pseudomonadota bacterium]